MNYRQFFIGLAAAMVTFISLQAVVGPRTGVNACWGGRWNHYNSNYGPWGRPYYNDRRPHGWQRQAPLRRDSATAPY